MLNEGIVMLIEILLNSYFIIPSIMLLSIVLSEYEYDSEEISNTKTGFEYNKESEVKGIIIKKERVNDEKEINELESYDAYNNEEAVTYSIDDEIVSETVALSNQDDHDNDEDDNKVIEHFDEEYLAWKKRKAVYNSVRNHNNTATEKKQTESESIDIANSKKSTNTNAKKSTRRKRKQKKVRLEYQVIQI